MFYFKYSVHIWDMKHKPRKHMSIECKWQTRTKRSKHTSFVSGRTCLRFVCLLLTNENPTVIKYTAVCTLASLFTRIQQFCLVKLYLDTTIHSLNRNFPLCYLHMQQVHMVDCCVSFNVAVNNSWLSLDDDCFSQYYICTLRQYQCVLQKPICIVWEWFIV